MNDSRLRTAAAVAIFCLTVPLSACSSSEAASAACPGPGECSAKAETGAYVPAWKTQRASRPAPARETGAVSQALTSPPSGSISMRPEWGTVAGTMIRWPVGWPELKATYTAMLPPLQAQGKVEIVVSGPTARAEAERDIRACRDCSFENIEWVYARTGSIWMRDYGPLSIYYGSGARRGLIDLDYYSDRPADDAFPASYATQNDLVNFEPEVSLEGGNFQADGRGNCFLSVHAAEQNGERYVRSKLANYFGCARVSFLEYLAEEGTHHIDMWMKLISPTKVLVGDHTYSGGARLSYPDDVNDEILDRTAARMEALGYEVVRIPQPPSLRRPDGGYTIRSYTNSTLANNAVLIPVYNERADRTAVAVYDRALPADVREVPIDASYIIDFGGAMHCITMERFPDR